LRLKIEEFRFEKGLSNLSIENGEILEFRKGKKTIRTEKGEIIIINTS